MLASVSTITFDFGPTVQLTDVHVAGPGASLLPAEIGRYQIHSIQRRRRHLALAAGTITLLVVGWTSWSFVEVVASLIDGRNSSQRNSLRYVQLGTSLVTLSVAMAVICWLKVSKSAAPSAAC